MLNEIESLKAQLRSKEPCFTSDYVKPKVLCCPGMYCIDVNPSLIPLRTRGQRVWKATGKLFADIGYQWRPTGKKLTLGKLDCGSQWRPTGKKFALGEICQLTKLSVKCSTLYANQQVMLWYLDSGCSKHMTGNRSKLMNFVEKFIGSVRFGNDHLGAIMGYGDYVMGDSVISRVYYVEGLGHNLFSVGQFCDSDLEVAFRKHTCFVRDIKGTDILKGSRGTNLYTISIDEMMKSSPICLLSKASKSKSWLWHRRLNHLNFGTINDLARKDLVRGLPRLKFEKDHLCSACQLGKSKKFSHRPKSENTNMEVLHTLHMDLCGPMRVQSIKGKKYILVIVDDYSRFTWVKFLRSKDETPEFVTNFLKQIQVGLNKTVRFIRTDNGTEFVNQVMSEYYEGVGIFHQKSVPRTPQQNGVVERRNRTLVEAARTMMIFSKAPMFLWAEAVATACYTQNRSLIHTRHNKTPYELVHDKKPDLTFFRVFGALCYPTNDSENLGKFQAKADIGIFVGYAPSRKGYRIYNKRTRRLMETIHVTFDEMHQSMAPARMSSGPEPLIMTPGQLKSGLAPTDKELEMLFQPIASSSTSDIHLPVQHQEIAEEPIHEDTPIIHDALHPSHNLVTGDPGSAQSSSGNVNSVEPNQVNYPPDHLRIWTKDHPLDNIWHSLSRTRNSNGVIEDCGFQAMQDEIHEFDRLEVWELVPHPIYVMVIALKWIYKVKLDEYGDVLDKQSLGCCKAISSGAEGIDFENHLYVARIEAFRIEAQMDVKTCFSDGTKGVNSMAEQNVPAQPLNRTEERCNTNFFQAFTASANVPAIYLQQFWKTMSYNEKTGVYSCQVDEQWFDLSADLLRKALAITPVHSSPIEYLVWAILSLLNQCLTGKTSGSDKPRHPVLQMLWGIVTQTNVDHAELIWEEFTQGIQTFFSHKASTSQSKDPKKKSKLSPHTLWTGFQSAESNNGKNPSRIASVQPAKGVHQKLHPSTPVKQTKPAPSPTKKPSKRKLPQKIRKGKPTFQLVDEEDEARQDDDPDLDLAELSWNSSRKGRRRRDPVSEVTPKLHEVVGKGKAVVTEEQERTDSGNRESAFFALKVTKIYDEVDMSTELRTRSDSGNTCVSAGPNPSTWMKNSSATAIPKGHVNLKLITDERVIDDKPESHSGSMSSMKNLDDTFNFGDQFLHDKPTEDEQEKSKVREESDSTIPDSSHQTATSTPPVIAPFTEVSSSKPSLLVTPPPINTEATTITTSLPEITPFIALQLRVAKLEQEMSEVKKTDHSADVLASIRSQVPTAIADEDAMDKEVADKVKDHKRKHDSDDDETWFKTRVVNKEKENLILLLLGQLKPPLKDDDKSLTQERYQNIMGQIAYATTFKVSEENKLQRKTYDIGSFIKWFCRRTGKKKLCKANLEGPAFNLVKAFPQSARYLDFGLEELVPSLWVESEREYDISAVYDITHWWFRRKEFYINKHSESSDREAVRSQMRILSVISVKAVRLNELHKFSDGTLTRVMEKLDQMVKDFHLYEYNKGMETRKWSEDDKRRSKDFITAIEKRLHDQKGIYRI
ncbi:retrovirus-related pol polyprotein from transposon TNT 1-94 [Tanacetum coccineum]